MAHSPGFRPLTYSRKSVLSRRAVIHTALLCRKAANSGLSAQPPFAQRSSKARFAAFDTLGLYRSRPLDGEFFTMDAAQYVVTLIVSAEGAQGNGNKSSRFTNMKKVSSAGDCSRMAFLGWDHVKGHYVEAFWLAGTDGSRSPLHGGLMNHECIYRL